MLKHLVIGKSNFFPFVSASSQGMLSTVGPFFKVTLLVLVAFFRLLFRLAILVCSVVLLDIVILRFVVWKVVIFLPGSCLLSILLN